MDKQLQQVEIRSSCPQKGSPLQTRRGMSYFSQYRPPTLHQNPWEQGNNLGSGGCPALSCFGEQASPAEQDRRQSAESPLPPSPAAGRGKGSASRRGSATPPRERLGQRRLGGKGARPPTPRGQLRVLTWTSPLPLGPQQGQVAISPQEAHQLHHEREQRAQRQQPEQQVPAHRGLAGSAGGKPTTPSRAEARDHRGAPPPAPGPPTRRAARLAPDPRPLPEPRLPVCA